jgi:hypothetical protein
MKLTRTALLQMFLILVFIMAQISPACAFVSGKMSLMEICAADGSSKTIKVSDAFDPAQKQTPQKDHKLQSECALCFSQAHIGKILLNAQNIQAIIPQSYRISSAGMIVPKTLKLHHSQPRAPPALS